MNVTETVRQNPQTRTTESGRPRLDVFHGAALIARLDRAIQDGDLTEMVNLLEYAVALLGEASGEDVNPRASVDTPRCFGRKGYADRLRRITEQARADRRAREHNERALADLDDARRFVAKQAPRPDLETPDHKTDVARFLAHTRAEAARMRQAAGARA